MSSNILRIKALKTQLSYLSLIFFGELTNGSVSLGNALGAALKRDLRLWRKMTYANN